MLWAVEVQASIAFDGEDGMREVWLPVGTVEVAPRTRRDAVISAAVEQHGLTPKLDAPAREVRVIDPRYVAQAEVAVRARPETVIDVRD